MIKIGIKQRLLIAMVPCSGLFLYAEQAQQQAQVRPIYVEIYNNSTAANQNSNDASQTNTQQGCRCSKLHDYCTYSNHRRGIDREKSMPMVPFIIWNVIKSVPIGIASGMASSYLFPVYAINRCIVYPLAQYLYGKDEQEKQKEKEPLVFTPNFFVLYPVLHNIKLLLFAAYEKSCRPVGNDKKDNNRNSDTKKGSAV